MINKAINIILIFSFIQIQALELVDNYIENQDTKRAINRLYFLAKDSRNFICSNTFPDCISPEDINIRIANIKSMSNNKLEKEIISNFFKEKEISNNIFIQSYLLYKNRNYFEAIESTNIILKENPNNIYALEYRAKSSFLTTDLSIAKQSYKKIIELKPEISKYYFRLIDIFLKEERFVNAENTLQSIKDKFPDNMQISEYQKRIDSSKHFWSSLFSENNDDKNIEEIDSNNTSSQFWNPFSWNFSIFSENNESSLKKIHDISDKEESNITENIIAEKIDVFSGFIELNRGIDDSIKNQNLDRCLIDNQVYGIDEIYPQEHKSIYFQPNINFIYNNDYFSNFNIAFRVNYNYRLYFNGNNLDYGNLTPTLTFKSKDSNYLFDMFFSTFQVDGIEISSYGFGTSLKFLDSIFRASYKLNSFSFSNLDRDTLFLSAEHKLEIGNNSHLRFKYGLTLNSLAFESQVPYILTDNRDDNNSSSIYPTSYISHKLSINYLIDIFEPIYLESGVSFQYRAFEVLRADMQTDLFLLTGYTINDSNKIEFYIRKVDNISDEKFQSFEETVFGLNYIFKF